MARTRVPSPPLARALFLAMAFMALALRVMVPAGYMAASPTNDHPFAIVLCSGDGQMTVQPGQALPGHDDKQAPGKDGQHAPCAFAGLAAGAVAPDLAATIPVVLESHPSPLSAAARDLAPGRGLPAPPPPARGPPSLLI